VPVTANWKQSARRRGVTTKGRGSRPSVLLLPDHHGSHIPHLHLSKARVLTFFCILTSSNSSSIFYPSILYSILLSSFSLGVRTHVTAPYKYHLLAVNTPKKMCRLRSKITCTGWAHSALRADWQSGGRGRWFFTVSAIQISSACGKCTKKDVPFGVQNNICLVGTYRPQSGVAAGDAGSSP
jgi:hypothetical protein